MEMAIALQDTLFDLAGKSAIVTGSSRGIGEAIAFRLAQHGANVVITGRKIEAAEVVARRINERQVDGFGAALAIAGNITKADDLTALLSEAKAAFGHIDILVANAALHIHVGPSREMTDTILNKTLDANFFALHRLSQALLPGMTARGFGRIVNISSVAALFGSGIYHSYTLSKSLALQYIRNIAVEHGDANIRANSVAPGLTGTDMAKSVIENPDILARELSRSTVGRYGTPDEIAGAVLFLVSAAGGYVNGQTIAVDGGISIRYE